MALDIKDILGLYWTFAILEIIIVSSRLWIRLRIVRAKFDVTDLLILLGLLFALIGCSANTWVMKNQDRFLLISSDPKRLFLNLEFTKRYLKVTFATSFFYYGTLYTIKGAFLALYFCLFKNIQRKQHLLLWTVTAYVISSFLVTLGQQTFTCWPASRNWNLLDYCTPFLQKEAFITATVLNVSSDLFILVLPLRILYSLRLPGREIFALVFILAIGSVAIAASIARFVAIWSEANADLASLNKRNSALYITFWSGLELGLAIIAVCLPAFRSWWRWVLERTQKQNFLSSYNYYKFKKGGPRSSGSKGAAKGQRGKSDSETDMHTRDESQVELREQRDLYEPGAKGSPV